MNPETTRLVWNGLCESDRLCRYYGYLAERLEKRGFGLAVAATALSSTTFAALLSPWAGASRLLAALATICGVALIAGHHSRKAIKGATIRRRYADLLLEWEELWSGLSKMEDIAARDRWKALSNRAIEITDGAEVELPTDETLRERSEREAYEYRLEAHGQPAAT